MKHGLHSNQNGVALLMVIFMIAITSAVLISLTESTFISMRLNRASEQRVKAEYLIKSAFNVARVLIKNDSTPTDDPNSDSWMMFSSSKDIPANYLDPIEPNVKVQMLITSEKGKIPLLSLVSGNTVSQDWMNVLINLFQLLGFDSEERSGDLGAGCRFQNPSFCTSTEMVGNLIDYLDRDEESYQNQAVRGIESDLPAGEKFRNQEVLDSPEELLLIPGFTPKRVQELLPLVTIETKGKVNINAAKEPVLQAIAKLDSDAPDDAGIEIARCRGLDMQGPFKQVQADIDQCFQSRFTTMAQRMASKMEPNGNVYRVITRVEYGSSDISFMGTAVFQTEGQGKLPKVLSMLVY
jgi:type II secretory pathway component PulK